MFKIVLLVMIVPNLAFAQVPYYKTRYEQGKECRYFYSGSYQNGMEVLVSVQCFDD